MTEGSVERKSWGRRKRRAKYGFGERLLCEPSKTGRPGPSGKSARPSSIFLMTIGILLASANRRD